MAIDKVKWLKEHGKLPQFNRQIQIVVDKEGNTKIDAEDKLLMKSKCKRDNTSTNNR